MLSAINADPQCNSAFSGRVWLDVEGGFAYWFTSVAQNKAWYQSLVDACGTYAVNCGIYSSWVEWTGIFGGTSYTYNPQFPLWTPRYDGVKSLKDFHPFGGWKTAQIKQYLGDQSLCGVPLDYNWNA